MSLPDTTALRAVEAAAVAELVWAEDGGVGAMPVVPLRLGDRVAVALPYAHADMLRTARSAPWAALVLSDPRLSGSAWRPLALVGRPELVEDVTGELFESELLDQELRKHPPSRALADSPLLRHENWWYLPRRLLTFEPRDGQPVTAREDPRNQALLAVSAGTHVPRISTVVVHGWSEHPIALDGGDDGEAALVTHDFSVPDMERWLPHVLTGRVQGPSFTVTSGQPGPPEPLRGLGLRERLRRHRELERGCRQGIRAAEQRADGDEV